MTIWDRYRSASVKTHALVLLGAVALSAGALSLTGRLEVDTQLESLLPEDTPTTRSLNELRDRVQADSPLTLLVHSSDPALNRRLQDEIARRVSEWDETLWATTARDLGPLRRAALLYLDAESLSDLADRTEERVDYEYCQRMPACISFDDEPPPMPTREELVGQVAETPNGKALEQLLGMPLVEWMEQERSRRDERDRRADEGREAEESPAGGGRLCTDSGDTCAVQAYLEGEVARLGFATQMLRRSEAMLDEVRAELGDDAPDDLRMAVSGRYRNAPVMKQQMNEDLRDTAILSTILLLIVLLLQFRDVRALVLLLAPLAVGLILTLGAIAIIHPSLNLVSAFTLAVLAGIGIDFGIHLLTYYGKLRLETASATEAIEATLGKLLSSLLAAGVTTGLAFAAVSASSFRGIAEMGWMAGIGIALSLLAYLVVFPSLAILMDRVWPQKGSLLREYGFRPSAPKPATARLVVVGGLVLAAVAAFVARGVTLERDFRNLRSPRVHSGIVASEAVGGTNGAEVYLLAETPEALRAAAEDLVERRYDGLSDEGPVIFFAPSLLLPSDQEPKLESLERMRVALDRMLRRVEDEEQRARLESFRAFVDRDTAVGPDDLPRSVRNSLTERDGTFGTVAAMYPPMRGSDGAQMERLATLTQEWQARYPQVRFASPHALLGEVLPALEGDAWMMIVLALLGLVVATGLFGRSPKRTALVLLPVLVAIAVSGALMVLFDLRVNLYNTLVFPVAFGMGIDGAVYITWATIDAPTREAFMERYLTSARAVIGAGVTSLCAFGSLGVAGNPGLASIGYLAVVAIGMTILTNLIWMPALILILRREDDGAGSDDGPSSDADADSAPAA